MLKFIGGLLAIFISSLFPSGILASLMVIPPDLGLTWPVILIYELVYATIPYLVAGIYVIKFYKKPTLHQRLLLPLASLILSKGFILLLVLIGAVWFSFDGSKGSYFELSDTSFISQPEQFLTIVVYFVISPLVSLSITYFISSFGNNHS